MALLSRRLRRAIRNRSIRAQLLWAFGLLVLLIAVLQVLYLRTLQTSRALEALEEKGRAICLLVSHDIQVAFEFGDVGLVIDSFTRALEDKDLEAIALVEADGSRFAEAGRIEAIPPVDYEKMLDSGSARESNRVLLFRPLGEEGERPAAVLVASFLTSTIRNQQRTDTIFALAMGAVILLVGFIVAWTVIDTSVTVPLARATRASEALAQGDVGVDFGQDSKSEIGLFLAGLSRTVGYLREMSTVADSIADGDLGVEVEPRSEVDRLGSAFKRMVESLRELASDLQETSQSVATSAEELSAASAQMRAGSRDQSQETDQALATIAEMTGQVQSISGSAQEMATGVERTAADIQMVGSDIEGVARRADSLNEAAAISSESIQNLLETNASIAERVRRVEAMAKEAAEKSETGGSQLRELIGAINKSSLDIGTIIEITEDIANQTRILAINASLEAARAGIPGRGFAVVAGGIRALAERARASIGEISAYAEAVRGTTERAATVTESIVSQSVESVAMTSELIGEVVQSTQDQRSEADQVLGTTREMARVTAEVVDKVKKQAAGVSEIREASNSMSLSTRRVAEATVEQRQAAEHVVHAVEQIARVTDENLIRTRELAHSAEVLELDADRLRMLASNIRVAGNGGQPSSATESETILPEGEPVDSESEGGGATVIEEESASS